MNNIGSLTADVELDGVDRFEEIVEDIEYHQHEANHHYKEMKRKVAELRNHEADVNIDFKFESDDE